MEEKQKKSPTKRPKKPKTYVVKKGDTIYSIAFQIFGDSRKADQIKRLNNLATDILKVGRVLILPK